jgi:hypothetical protein
MGVSGPVNSLVVCPVGKAGKEFVRKIVERFGHDSFDFLLLVYDDTCFDERGFADCTVVHDELPLFWRLRKHVTAELCRHYEYVFIWMDDLDVLDFDPQNFLCILRAHHIEVGHPALSPDSVISHLVMERQDTTIGRYTEILGFAFRGDLWERFWRLIEPDRNPWGWGYDEVAYSVCRFRRIAIIDGEVIKHTRKGSYHAAVAADHQETQRRYSRHYLSRKKTLCEISDQPWRKYIVTPLWLHLHWALAQCFVLPGIVGLRRLIRTCRERLWVTFGVSCLQGLEPPEGGAPNAQPALDTPGTGIAPAPTREEAVCLSDRPPAASQDESTQKPKRKRRTPVVRRAKVRATK